MERKIMERLKKWKNSPRRMPLLLDGARQVGKTYTALMFGKSEYKNTVYINLEDSSEIQAVFEEVNLMDEPAEKKIVLDKYP